MRRIFVIFCCVTVLSACDKHDPILPGVRTPVFDTDEISVQNKTITDIPETAYVVDNSDCSYTQDSNNVVWDGARKIFSGFPTNNTVSATPRPVCSGKYIYAGLTTGELVKLNPKNREIIWIADIYRTSNMTGGASVVDIVAPIVPYGDSVYAGGLGDAFCRVNATSGDKKWCVNIATANPFVIAGNYAFVVSTDNNLYSILLSDGSIFWRAPLEHAGTPEYTTGRVTIGQETFNVESGKKILDK